MIGDQGSGIRDQRVRIAAVLLLAFVGAGRQARPALAQTPRLSNGRIEPHATTSIAKDLRALAATLTEPTWLGYAQPMIDGEHNMCDYWNDGRQFTQSTDPVRLEPADFFFVLFRVENKEIIRIRTFSANCPLDAGGKAVHWFTNVAVTDSVAFLKTFIGPNATRRLMDSAVTAMALTEGQQPLHELTTLAREGTTTNVKGSALFWLAQRAGQKAVGTITAAIENDPDTEVKKKAVFALSQLPKDEGVPMLIDQARNNKNAAVRKQAMFWLGQSKDPRALKFFEEILSRR